MRGSKRLLSVLMAVCMLVALFAPAAVAVSDTGKTEGSVLLAAAARLAEQKKNAESAKVTAAAGQKDHGC